MNGPLQFLIVDDVDENRFLIGKTLLRKFPGSLITECEDSAPALDAARLQAPALIIVHRTRDLDGVAVIRALRQISADVPIIMVSGRESCPEAIEAGANAFLNYDAWLRIATVAEEVMSPQFVKALTASPFRSSPDFLGFRPGGERSAN